MADQTAKIQQDHIERVAFDLMAAISMKEETPQTREYYFTLYYQCRRPVLGFSPKQIQQEG
jgi:hypothetical protein